MTLITPNDPAKPLKKIQLDFTNTFVLSCNKLQQHKHNKQSTQLRQVHVLGWAQSKYR